jgi:hypothetical protein
MGQCIALPLDPGRDPMPPHYKETPPSVAKEYYEEIVLSLKCAPSRKDIVDTLDEFAAECKTSLELKRIALRDMNLLFAVYDICRKCLFLSSPLNDCGPSSGPWNSCLDQISAEWLEFGVPDDIRDSATEELRERVIVYRAALNVRSSAYPSAFSYVAFSYNYYKCLHRFLSVYCSGQTPS